MFHRIGIGWLPLLTLTTFALLPARATAQSIEYTPRVVLANPVRPITHPPIVEASASRVQPNDLVIGVEFNGDARAYPINQLTGPSREIINDHLGGSAIAATW